MPAVTLITDRVAGEVLEDHADAVLAAALSEQGATVETRPWTDVDQLAADLVVIRHLDLDPARRETFLAWARDVQENAALVTPVEVLRWNSHRSYLLELEERGAPVVPTAWAARGDRIDLPALLAARGWDRAVIAPAVPGSTRVAVPVGAGACDVAAGQGALDRLLTLDDVTIQQGSVDGLSGPRLAAIVIEGQVSHVLSWEDGSAGEATRVDDAEAAALAAWVVGTTGVDLAVARVELRPDDLGTLQLVSLDAVAPDLGLHAAPDAAGPIATAILHRLPQAP